MAGLTQIVAVFDARIYRVVKAAGCNPQLIGRPQRIGDTMSYVGVFDTGNSPLAAIRRAVGIQGSVLVPETPRAYCGLDDSRLLRLGWWKQEARVFFPELLGLA